MNPFVQIGLTIGGFLALIASLLARKRAGWLAVLGAAAIVPVALWNVDPVLGFGLVVVLLVHVVHRRRPCASREAGTAAGRREGRPAQDS